VVLLEITNFLLQRYLERLKPICHPQGAPQNGCLFCKPELRPIGLGLPGCGLMSLPMLYYSYRLQSPAGQPDSEYGLACSCRFCYPNPRARGVMSSSSFIHPPL
jgi:hypothetical protein